MEQIETLFEPSDEITAIVIDDNITGSLGVKVALNKLGIDVVSEVNTIEDALGLSAQIVCCDLSLSRTGLVLQGAEGVEALVRAGKNVVAMSVIALPNQVGDVVGAGALAYLDRAEFQWEDFALAVKDVVTGQRHLSKSLAARLLSDLNRRPLPDSLELDSRSQEMIRELLLHDKSTQIQSQELDALTSKIWSVWAKRRTSYKLTLSKRQLEMLRLFHLGIDVKSIARELKVAIRTVQADQDKVKTLIYQTYGKDLKREAACRLVWQIIDGQIRWANAGDDFE